MGEVSVSAIDVPFPEFRKGFRSDINTIPEKADELRKQYGGTEATLYEAVEAEKQHLVPYKRLKRVFKLEGKARPGRYEVHNIGNLTYISHGLNNYKTGIGSDPLKLDTEPQDNLQAHLLMDRQGDLLKAYSNACRNADPDNRKNGFKRDRQYFDKFSKKRRALIAEAFLLWEDDIRSAGRFRSSIDNRPAKLNLIKNIGEPKGEPRHDDCPESLR